MKQVTRYVCDKCLREHDSEVMARRCELNDAESEKAMADKRIADVELELELKVSEFSWDFRAQFWRARGHDVWNEHLGGVMIHAPMVDPETHGKHDYYWPGDGSECRHGCGCWMGLDCGGGPVNPCGPCPKNPKKEGGDK